MTSWVPSHVELTIHQARDLLLKTKNSGSVVYVSVVADREKSQSPPLPPSTAPLWQFTSRIPLMSLDTTLFCCVRQKTSLKDKFLGLVSIPLSTFNISSKTVTHWYKLGAKAGKTSSKLRGELLLSIQFLSDWVAKEPEIADFAFGSERENKRNHKLRTTKSVKFSSSSLLGFRRKSMLKRTKSEVKSRAGSDTSSDSVTGGGGGGEAGEKGGRKKFRLSIKKRTRSPVLEECTDEFMSLSLPGKTESPVSSASSPSQTLSPLQQLSGEGDVFDGRTPTPSESLSRSLDSKQLPNGHGVAPGVCGGGNSGGEGGVEEDEGKSGNQEPAAEKMSPALRYHNYRRKKRPWSMHTLPLTPQSDREDYSPAATPNSTPLPGPLEEEQSEERPGEEGEGEVVTYRAKSSLTRGVANGVRRIGRSNSTVADSNCGTNDDSTSATPTRSPQVRSRERHGRSSGLGNVALSSTLPASIRRRSQSVGGASARTPPTPRRAGQQKREESERQSMMKIKAMGLGPRVPLATSLTDSPRRGSGGRTSPAHLFSEDHSPRSSPLAPRTNSAPYPRNPSPIHLQSPLVEEEEEEEEGVASPTRVHSRHTVVEYMVKSRVPIETENAAFKVDASELEIVLEAATPRRRSIVALPQQSTSLPGSPMGSPARQRKLPMTPGSTPESTTTESTVSPTSSSSSSQSPRKLPRVPDNLAPQHGNSARAHSTSPVVTSRGSGGEGERGGPCLSGRSASVMALSGERESVDGGVAGSAKIRHSVSFKEKPTHCQPTKDYEPLPALPPCMMHSHTLPRHTQLSRRRSELDRPLSNQAGPFSALPGPNSTRGVPHFAPKQVEGVHNIRTFDPRLFNLQPQSPQKTQQPRVSITNASIDETDSPSSSSVSQQSPPSPPPSSSATRTTSTQTRSVTPEMPHSPTKSSTMTQQKLSKTYPGTPSSSSLESGVTMGGVKRGGGGGLQAAISRYQENRRRGSKGSPSRKTSGDSGNVRLTLAELGGQQKSSSAGSSPVVQQRKASTHLGHTPRSPERGWRNPFSNLRRTQSHKTPPTGRSQQLENTSRFQGSTESVGVSSTSSSPGETNRSLDDQLVQRQLGSAAARNTNSNNEQRGSQSVVTPTSLPSDTDSLRTFGSERTLVEGGGSGVDHIGTPSGPSGQTLYLSLPPSSRHKQTCSSVDSEGLGSLASEEIEEAGPLDWAQLSREELVKELVQSKSRLHSTEEELKAVRGYLDNLLLRIMETSPAILSVENP